MARGPAFTPEEDRILCEMYEQRAYAHAIAQRLGRGVGSVQTRLSDLGIRRSIRKFTSEEDTLIRDLNSKGMLIGDIAKQTGRTAASIRKRIYDLGCRRDYRRTCLARRYGSEIVADGRDPLDILVDIRRKTEQDRLDRDRAEKERVTSFLSEMQKCLDCGVDRVIVFRMGRCAGITLQDIADKFDLSRERVRQITESIS